jgi:hypothetical protein
MKREAMRQAGLKAICVAVPRSLLLEARHVALDQRTTLQAMVGEGLAHVVAQRKSGMAARPAGAVVDAKTEPMP